MGTAEENHAKLMEEKPWEDFGWDQKTWEQTVDYTPYEGMQVKGWPRTVLSRGEIIVRDGLFVGSQGRGRYLKRTR